MESGLGINLTTVAEFMSAAQGNYRNALYIRCSNCAYSRESHCGDFLFISGPEGAPILFPVSDAEQFFGYTIDPTDCSATISNQDFLRLYYKWIVLHTKSDGPCPFHQILCHTNKEGAW